MNEMIVSTLPYIKAYCLRPIAAKHVFTKSLVLMAGADEAGKLSAADKSLWLSALLSSAG